MHSIQIVAAALALLGTPASAFWRMECRGVSGRAQIDPILKYGETGGHVHEIFGGQGKFSPGFPAQLNEKSDASCS